MKWVKCWGMMLAVSLLTGTAGAQEIAEIQILDFSKKPAVVNAAKELGAAFDKVLADNSLTDVAEMRAKLKSGYYSTQFGVEYKNKNGGKEAPVAGYVDSLSDTAIALQYYYVETNANVLGSKHKLDKGADASAYSAAHAKYQPDLRAYLEEQGLYDIFLYRLDGQNIYTCFKELDFARSVNDPSLAATNLAEVVKAVAAASDKGFTILVDMKPYVYSYDLPARFVATGVYDGDVKIGVLVFQLPPGM
jgi:methyl-accepting chemotaxis protein